MLDALLKAAQEAVEIAKNAGANEVFASSSRSREVEFSLRDGKLEEVKDATSAGLSLRLWVDGRYSTHSTNDLRPDRMAAFIGEAVALTRALAPDPHRTITDPALYAGRGEVKLDLVDESVRALTREDRMALCEAQNSLVAGQEGVISATSGVSDSHSAYAAASSNGFSGTHEATALWLGSSVTMRDEGGAKPAGSMWGGAAHRGDIPKPDYVAKLAFERAKQRLGSKKGPTQRTVMVVDPAAAPSLIGRLLGSANASSIQQGRSFFAGKIGQKIVSDVFTLVDDPFLPRGFASRLWDGEGIALQKRPIIEKGVLNQIYVDTYYGGKLGMTPNGSSTNKVIGLGTKPLEALLADAGQAIYVTSWLGGNADGTTGDFSFGIRGHQVEGGKIGAPVGEMNITGNLLDLFSRLVAVGNDPWPYSSTLAPTLVFEGVQFSGA